MNDATATPKHRSSPFPFISLRKALERAREFYGQQRQHAAPASVAVQIWKYGAKSSGGSQTIAALKHFGLLRDEGSGADRKVALTQLALRIIRDLREQSPDRDQFIKEAALAPKLHKELWERFGPTLPSEGSVFYYLEVERGGFTDRSARELLAEYQDTIAFAGLDVSDRVSGQDADVEDVIADNGSAPHPPDVERRRPIVQEVGAERVVFTHEIEPSHHLRLIVSGDVDDEVLDALEVYLSLQRKRQERRAKPTSEAPD